MGLVASKDIFKPYSETEKEKLAKRYTPEQMQAIEAAEEAINPDDLNERGVIRTDWGSLNYLDDFSTMAPVLDKKLRRQGPIDPEERLMTMEEYGESHKDYIMKIIEENKIDTTAEDFNPEEFEEHSDLVRPNRLDMYKMFNEVPDSIGPNGPLKSQSLLAPGVPRNFEAALDEEPVKKIGEEEEEDTRDPDGRFNLLMKQTGLSMDDIFGFTRKVLVRHRVVNQTRLGKISSTYVLAIAGNGKGRLGLGQAKGQEPIDTMSNAMIQAIRSMRPIPRYEDRTIFGDVQGKVSAVEVKLMARPPGMCQSPNGTACAEVDIL